MRISDWSSDVCSSDLSGRSRASCGKAASTTGSTRRSWSGIPRTWIVDDGCLRATRASEAFACRQVAPRPDGQPGQRNPADADAPDCHHVKAHLRARVAQLPALHALESEAQADIVLPADLPRLP